LAFIGIDLGTSFIKAAVLDLDASELQQVRRMPFPEPISLPNPLRVEFDPDSIVATVKKLIDELADSSVPYEGVVMCTQMSCLVLMDEKGKAWSNCMGWRDQRALEPHPSGSGSYYDVLKQRLTAKQKRELGNELPPGAPICFLFWMVDQGKLEPGLAPVSLADFVLSALCGSPPSVESTNAMACGLLQLETLGWHEEVIKELGLGKLHWPPIRQHGEVVGRMKVGANTVPCYTPVGDYQCALAGALLAADELSLNISTGSQVSRMTNQLVLGDYQTRPFFDAKFTNTFSHLPAGRSLNVLVDLLGEFAQHSGTAITDPWQYIARAAAAVAHTDLEVRLSFFPGPCGDKGSIANIREQNLTVGTLFRASFENMAQNYYDCALRIWPDRSWKNIVFSGGLARKLKLLRKIIEQRFQTSSRLCPLEEDTLLGLMALARVFSHRAGSVQQAMHDFRLHYDAKPDAELSTKE
jgi:sugar (pentulose or hexulose) kinase